MTISLTICGIMNLFLTKFYYIIHKICIFFSCSIVSDRVDIHFLLKVLRFTVINIFNDGMSVCDILLIDSHYDSSCAY